MKKALALVLALVLALSMAVSAFAADVVLELVPTASSASKITIDSSNIIAFGYGEENTELYAYKGGTYYFAFKADADADTVADTLTDIKVTPNGNLTAELIKYDPEKVNYSEAKFALSIKGEDELQAPCDWCGKLNDLDEVCVDECGGKCWPMTVYKNTAETGAKDLADAINEDAQIEIATVVTTEPIYLIKVVLEDNYTAHYTKGTIKIEAYDKDVKKNVAQTVTIINDVVIFEYENVKYAAKYDKPLLTWSEAAKGYSDYETEKAGYDLNWVAEYDWEALRQWKAPFVVSTTAFRAIEGKNLSVIVPTGDPADEEYAFNVEIKKVAAGQKGVNFYSYFKPVFDDATAAKVTAGTMTTVEALNAGKAVSLDFGFKGNQVIASDFDVTVDLNMTWFTLREIFGIKVEEDDIVSYYVLKDGKLFKELKVDYMTIDPDESVLLELEGKVGQTLGQYELVLEVPAAGATESNPNTGAESVVGVVAALAVVSLASAAAVSLKK